MTAAIILAAGTAARMGRLKQILPFRGATLLEHAIRQAAEAGFDPIVVVTGAESAKVREAIQDRRVNWAENPDWQSGMGSSVATGMRRLRDCPGQRTSVAILVGDQPLVGALQLSEMARQLKSSDASVIAAEYNGTVGVPAIFKDMLFSDLELLPPEAGARHLLRSSTVNLIQFPLPEAGVDLDTPEDVAALTSAEQEAGFPAGPGSRK